MINERGIVQGLEKGLDLLAFLNRGKRLSAADIVRGIGLPRTTTLRLLDTLAANGFVERSRRDRRYQLTVKVRTLSDGFDDEAWLTEVASPQLRALAAEVVWPVLIAIPLGTNMVWRENTDHETTLVLNRFSVGMQTTILGSASGRVYLAFSSEQERSTIVELIANTVEGAQELPSLPMLDEMLNQIRSSGCAIYKRPGEYSLAVPIMAGDQYLASLVIRVMASAMSGSQVISRYQPSLVRSAELISANVRSSIKEDVAPL